MRLHACPPPAGPLEAAPVTALRPAGTGVWAGFWSGDDGYYARHTSEDGRVEWYQVATEEDAPGRPRRLTPARGTRVRSIARPLALVGRVGRNAVALVATPRRRRA